MSRITKFARKDVGRARNSYRQSMPSRAWRSAPLAVTFATVLVLAPALAACGPGIPNPFPKTKTVTATATPTTSTTSQQDAIEAWWETTRVAAQELGDAMDKMGTAADREDPTTLGITCQEAHDAVEKFREHQPSPDPQLTAQLEKALSDYDAAARICTTAMENGNLDDLKQAGALICEGNTYMNNAVDILRRDRGESPDKSSDTPGRQGCTSPSDGSSSPTASTQASDPDQDSEQRLRQLASSDRPFVQANLADWWIPQISSKSSTEPWTVDPEDGLTYYPLRILREHQQLRQKYPAVRLLWAGDWSTFSEPNFWITVVGITFPERAGALGWCKSQGLDEDHCTATQLHN